MMVIPEVRTERLRHLVRRPLHLVRSWLTPQVRRRIWKLLSVLALGLVAIGLIVAWRELPTSQLHFNLTYLALAIGIYIVTFSMHLVGWHALATYFFGRLPFRENVEAVAASNFVKYLPTIAWYIANRADYYHQRDIPAKSVVAASLSELAAMIGSGIVLLLIAEVVPYGPWLALPVFVAIGMTILSTVRSEGRVRVWWRRRIRGSSVREERKHGHRHGWLVAASWYAATWPMGVCFLWAILHIFVPLQAGDLLLLFNIWLLGSLASYAVSLSLGSIGIAREITLTFMLSQFWPLPVVVAAAVMVKTLLTLGEIVCSLLILGWLYVDKRRRARG